MKNLERGILMAINVLKKIENDEQIMKIDSSICPVCGGRLKQRKGPYGDFIGCSNYPKCRYTKKSN